MNNTLLYNSAKEFAELILDYFIFWSSYVVNYISNVLVSKGFPLNATQISILIYIIDFAAIFFLLIFAKKIGKPILTLILTGLCVWFFLGFAKI